MILHKNQRKGAIIMDYPPLFLANDSIQNILSSKVNHRKITFSAQSEFKCKICEYQTSKKELMRQHNLVKHSGNVNKCSACDYTHYFAGRVRKHFNHVHLKMRRKPQNRTQGSMACFEADCKNIQEEDCKEMGHNKVCCKQCDYSAFTKRTMKFHVDSKHEGIITQAGILLPCNQCDFRCARKDQLNDHTNVTHDGEVFNCNQCGNISNTKRGLRLHISRHSMKLFECDKCDYKCAEGSSFKKHIKTLHNGPSLKQENRTEKIVDTLYCGQCDRRFKTKAVLNRHAQTAHNKIGCRECNYFAYSERAMQNHDRRIHKGVSYKHRCSQCSFDTKKKDKLKKHIGSLHEGEHTFCFKCEKNFKSEPSLSKHTLFDHEETLLEFQPTADALHREEKFMEKKDNETKEEYDKYDSYDEDEEDQKIVTKIEMMDGEVQYDKLVPEVMQQSEKVHIIFKCDDCSFSTENKSISKLHLLSHNFSESEILKAIPSSLKDLTFDSEKEFKKNIEMFLTSLSSKDT